MGADAGAATRISPCARLALDAGRLLGRAGRVSAPARVLTPPDPSQECRRHAGNRDPADACRRPVRAAARRQPRSRRRHRRRRCLRADRGDDAARRGHRLPGARARCPATRLDGPFLGLHPGGRHRRAARCRRRGLGGRIRRRHPGQGARHRRSASGRGLHDCGRSRDRRAAVAPRPGLRTARRISLPGPLGAPHAHDAGAYRRRPRHGAGAGRAARRRDAADRRDRA